MNNNKKVLTLLDVILMTIASNFGIRWIAVAAGIGPSSIFLWLFGALLFFIPLAIITAQMSRAYPDEGGIYAWTRRTLGEGKGFIVAWLYWVNNIFFYPAVLIFLASNLAYVIGKPELTSNTTYITSVTLIAFWVIVAISILGLKINKYLVSAGGIFGGFLPILLLITFSIIAYIKWGVSATNFNFHQFIPGGQIKDNLSSLAMIMFAMAGVEVTATFANRVERPKRDLYVGLLLASAIIFILYVAGTLAMNILITPNAIQKTSGLMQSFATVDNLFHISWFTPVVGAFLTFAELAAVVVWLLAPVVMFFKCTPKNILPSWMHETDKNGTPVKALVLQGAIVSFVMIITCLLPSVNAMYEVLVLMSTILYFIPYLFLAIVYFRSIKNIGTNKWLGILLSIGVFISVVLGIAVSFIPPSDLKNMHDITLYEIELILGPVLFIGLGGLLYRRNNQ